MTGTEILEDTVQTRWRRLSPLTVWADGAVIVALLGLAAVVVAVVLGVVGVFVPWGPLAVLASVLLAGVLVGGEVLRYRHTHYRVTGERLEVRSGVLARAHLSLSRDRIRSVDLATPLWTRPFGLCKVTVGTGQKADSGEEITLTYVETAEGDRLRRELLHQATDSADAGPDEKTTGEEPAPPIATMTPVWFGYGVAAPGPATVAYSVIVATAASLSEFGVRWFIGTYVDAGAIPSAGFVVISILLALAGAVALASVGALALHVEAWWNYRLTREPDGTLRVQRGLLNLSSVSIEERRLRGVEVRAPLPLRWFGAASVAAVASGLGTEGGGQKSLVPKRSLSPEVPRAQAERIAAASLPGAVFGPLTAHPGVALRRRLVRAAAAVAGLTVVAVVLTLVSSAEPVARTPVPTVPLWVAAAVLLVSAPVAGLYAWGCYRGLGHGLTERHLTMRRGMAARSTAVLKREAVIGWTIRRSFFQRRAGLATIGATIAADKGVFHAADTDSSEGLAFAEEAVPGLLTPFLERG